MAQNGSDQPSSDQGHRSHQPDPEDQVLGELVHDWLSIPEVAETLDVDLRRVRSWVRERELVAVRRTDRAVWQVPADFLLDGDIVAGLKGTFNVLADCGLSDGEAIVWLFTPDETLPGTPMDFLRQGRKAEIRRRAQALA